MSESQPLLPTASVPAVPVPLLVSELVESSVSADSTSAAFDHALPSNKARELLSHDLALSRVRLANWTKRVRHKRKVLDRLVNLQLVSSVVSTIFATLAAIMATIAANGERKPTDSALNTAVIVAVLNAVFGALASLSSTFVGQIRRGQEDEKEPEVSQARVAELAAWRQEAANYILRYREKWLDSVDEDVQTLSHKLPPDVPV